MFLYRSGSVSKLWQRMQQPCWPVWQWPAFAQWGAGSLVVLVCAGVAGQWVWVARSKVQESTQTLGLMQAQLQALREDAALHADVSGDGTRPVFGELGELSARWVAQAEQAGLRVTQWQITPISAAGTVTNAAEPAMHKAGFSAQVQGPYVAIKSWLGQTLEMQPWLVVDKLQWRLSDVGSGMLEAQITWSVYVAD